MNLTQNGYVPTTAGRVYAPRMEQRNHAQYSRVQDGKADGSLTSDETAELAAQRASIQNDLTISKADNGNVGPAERRMIHTELNGLSQSIFALKHN